MRSLFVGLTLFLSVFSNVALAQDDDAAFTETYIKRTDGLARQNVDGRLKPLGFGLMGDSIDPSSGALTFSTTDVELKGNSKLEVAFRRRAKQPNRPNYQAGTIAQRKQQMLADWIVDVPFVSGTSIDDPSFDMANICERLVSDLREGEASIGFNGYDLNIPGRGMQKILGGGGAPNSPNPFSPSDWGAGGFPDMAGVTADHSKIGCITDVGAANGGGQGLLVITPDGTTYRMDRLFTVSVGTEPRACGNAGSLLIKEGRLVATEVTDVHGNWVKYTYTSDGRLTKILGNDGRQIDIAYISGTGNIQTVTANGRVWTYSYEDVAASSTRVLRSVALPDGRSWQYNIDALTGSSGSSLSVVHPYGTSATYAVASPTHYTRRWTNYDGCGGFGTFTRADRNLAVTSKSLSGPNIPTSTWQYSYSNLGTIEFDSSNTETANVKNSVTEPDGSLTDTWYYIAGSRMGKPLSSRTYSSAGGSLLEELSYTYNVGTPLAPVSGLEFSQFSDSLKQPVLVSKKVVTRGSDTFTTDISYNSDGAQSNYSYGNPVQISSYSNQSSQVRTKVIAYEHDKTNWILGMPTRITRNGKVFDELTYDEFGNVQTHDQFGVRQVSYTYDAAGMVASSTDALNRTTYYDNWKRGEAQEITRPDGVTLLETVDDNGWVTSQVDGKGNQTGYQYSNVGWLTKIDRPAPWEDTSFTYDDVGGANFRQTAVRGTAETVIWYDVLHRPWNKRVRPLSGGGLTSYTRVAYDAGGREAFRSFPSTSADPADGTTFTYDGLGRRRASAENIAPFATTNYAYLAGNKTQVTDPEGNVTTSTVQAYGSPEKGDVVQIAQPLGRNTDMAYDNYGNMLTATQYGSQNGFSVTSTQRYFYDTRLRLCRHSVPESGDTLMDYDDANQMVGVAKGQSPGTGCAALPVGAKIASTYDSLGRLTLVDFPGGTPDINYTYDNNSKVTRNQRGIADWRYTYDNADNLTEEKLLIDGRSYATSYEYDGLGAVAYQTFPTGRRVDFAPNGLGRATKVQHVGGVTYAAGMTYHPNGDVDNITFGNGFIRDTALNNRQELAAIHVGNGANTVMDLSYGHDANNRITSITDGVAASENRAFTYDGLGRVLTASGPWGAGSFKYDALDNIRQKVLGSRTVNIEYNAANRVVRAQDSSDGNAWKNYSYDADGNVENSGVYVFSYDFSDQPVTITGSTTNGAFSYDGNL
jgi:YD repeat-containing protein